MTRQLHHAALLQRLAIGFGGIGCVALLVAAGFGFRSRGFLERAVPVRAEVMRVDEIGTGGEAMHTPTFRVDDGESGTRRVTMTHASSDYDFRVGSRVPILFDSADPRNVRVDTFLGLWGVASIAAGIAAMCLLLSVGLAAGAREQRPHAEVETTADAARPPKG